MSSGKERYDVIVIGSAIGGLFAASLIARNNIKNISILILKEKAYETYLFKDGYRFIPFSNFSELNLNRTLKDWVIEELNISLPAIGNSLKSGPESRTGVSYQVLLPDNRIDIINAAPLFMIELEREFRNELDRIRKFYDEIRSIRDRLKDEKGKVVPSNLFPAYRANLLRKWISSIFKGREINKILSKFSKEFGEFIKAQLIAFGNFYSNQISLSLSAYNLTKGTGEIDKTLNIEKLNTIIINKLNSLGVRIQEVERIGKIERRKDNFIINLDEEERILESRFIIINHPIKNIPYISDDEKRHLSKWERLIKPCYIIIPFFLGIKEKVVPVGMKDLLVSIFNIDKPYDNGNLIYVFISPRGDEFWAPRGRRSLVVEALIPYKDINSLGDIFKKYVFLHLNHIIPFLEDYIDLIDFEWTKKQVSCWSYPHLIYEGPKSFDWRAGIIPNKISRNLFFIGKENFPYLGLEGELISAYFTAHDILNILKKS